MTSLPHSSTPYNGGTGTRSDAPGPQIPVHLTGFVGREREITEIQRLLATTRLLTLTGAGGSGKTRLAQEVLTRSADGFPREIAWIELASLGHPDLVPQQVAAGLTVREEGGRSATEALVRVLRHRPLLLVLDNCEHVVDACAALVDVLLRNCPDLQVLATSREPLGIAGERAWLVPPLSLPPADPNSIEALGGSEAVRLFVERARDARPSFALTDANANAVAEICCRLDGIPLALELAAARVRVLSPEQIAARLDDAFRLLTTGGRTALPRHRTLRAVMDWSYDLLGEAKQALLRRLSVFSGGFTLEAAEAVCTGGAIQPEEVLDLLTHLVDRSLVVVREREGSLRYELLETVRQYAAERLAEAGNTERLQTGHAEFFFALVQEAEPHFTTAQRRAWIDRVYLELGNVRHALDWTRDHDPKLHVRLAGMLCWFWFSSRHWSEGRRRLEAALALPEAAEATRERAAVLFAAGVLATLQGQSAVADPWLEESAKIAAALGDGRLEAYALNYLGMALITQGLPQGRGPTEVALAWFRKTDEPYGLRLALLILSTLSLAQGDTRKAKELAEEGTRVARRFGQDRELAVALQCLADVALKQGDLSRAAALYQESLAALHRDPFYVFIARALEHLAVIRCDQGAVAEGARLFGAAATVRETVGAAPFKLDQDRYAPRIAAARAALGEEFFAQTWEEGRAMGIPEAIGDARSLPEAAASAAPAEIERVESGHAPTAAMLCVRALGPLEIELEGVPHPPGAWSHVRPRELLFYLLCHPKGRTRGQIGLAIWPDASAGQVKNNFHVALHHLRKTLGRPDWITLEGERYLINPAVEVWFDASMFEREVVSAMRDTGDAQRQRLGAALELYRGDFLEGETVGEWHLELYDRLRRLYVDGLSALGNLLMAEERLSEAADVWQRLLHKEDLREDVHRWLMVCQSRLGLRAEALRQYERLVTVLRDELETEPEPETTQLYERLKRAEPV